MPAPYRGGPQTRQPRPLPVRPNEERNAAAPASRPGRGRLPQRPPDVQGYGDIDASAADEGYAPSNMAADVVGLLDALGAELEADARRPFACS